MEHYTYDIADDRNRPQTTENCIAGTTIFASIIIVCSLTFYHPQPNGGVEGFHQSLKNGLRAHLAQGCSFNQAICLTLLHYRASHHCTTGISPISLMLGTVLNLKLTPETSPRFDRLNQARQTTRHCCQ